MPLPYIEFNPLRIQPAIFPTSGKLGSQILAAQSPTLSTEISRPLVFRYTASDLRTLGPQP